MPNAQQIASSLPNRSPARVGQIDRASGLPLYQQIKSILLDSINQGVFPIGALLPGERELEDHFRVSRITVRQGLAALVNEGYLRRESGRGTFVLRTTIDDPATRRVGSFLDLLQATGRNVSWQTLNLDWQVPPPQIVDSLGIESNEPVLKFDRLFFVDGTPQTLALHWIKIAPHQSQLRREILEHITVWDALEQYCGIFAVDGEKTLQAVSADASQAELLKVPQGTPLMRTELTLRDARGQPCVVAEVIHVGSTYKFHTLVHR